MYNWNLSKGKIRIRQAIFEETTTENLPKLLKVITAPVEQCWEKCLELG